MSLNGIIHVVLIMASARIYCEVEAELSDFFKLRTVENRVTDTPIQTHHQLPPPLCRIYLTQELGLLQTLWKLHVLYHMYDITPGRNTDLEKSSPQNRILFLLDQFQ